MENIDFNRLRGHAMSELFRLKSQNLSLIMLT